MRTNGRDVLLVARLREAFRRLRPDVVHTHNPSPMFYGVTAALAAGVRRRVHTKHGKNIYGSKAGLYAARLVVRGISYVVCVSEPTAAVAREKERVPEARLRVIPNGIPLGAFAPSAESRARLRAELGIPERAFVVGSVGRLAKEKDYPLLVRAMTPLLGEETRLVIAGAGAHEPEIRAAIEPRVARFVHLLGLRRDVPAVLAALDVFTLTSTTEGLPLAIPEAMACGLPVVATAVGGVPSVVTGETGDLVPSGDREALTARFERMRGDVERRKRMAEAARRYALREFSIEAMTD